MTLLLDLLIFLRCVCIMKIVIAIHVIFINIIMYKDFEIIKPDKETCGIIDLWTLVDHNRPTYIKHMYKLYDHYWSAYRNVIYKWA